MAIKAEIKVELKAAGLWREFCSIRDQLKLDGMTPLDAKVEALVRVESDLEAWRKSGDSGLAAVSAGAGRGAPEPVCCPGEGAPVREKGSAPDAWEQLTDEEHAEFMGRKADVISIYAWVGDHLGVPARRLKILEAPSPVAWNLLMDARRTSVRKSEFLDKSYSKLLPSRANLDDSGVGVVDGMHIVEAIDRLVAIRVGAEGSGVAQLEARGVHDPEVAGSSPAPATVALTGRRGSSAEGAAEVACAE